MINLESTCDDCITVSSEKHRASSKASRYSCRRNQQNNCMKKFGNSWPYVKHSSFFDSKESDVTVKQQTFSQNHVMVFCFRNVLQETFQTLNNCNIKLRNVNSIVNTINFEKC